MRSELENWYLESEWLNAFAEMFAKDTRGMVHNVAIEADGDCVVVCGHTRSYYAVQLAIHCVQAFHRDRSPFAMTRLSLEVNNHSLELCLSHQVERVPAAKSSTSRNERRRELTFA
ncbi:MAG: hypothetical protein IT422_03835 [Pirellulaceae bacterium]|nr:hypothetical protein [Pirellulaceae bacterium]